MVTGELISAPRAVASSFTMATLFVLGLALIQTLFRHATPGGDDVTRALEMCSMAAGYCLLALPTWGIFDTLRRTHLYIHGPRHVIALGYIALMASLLYVSYQAVMHVLLEWL